MATDSPLTEKTENMEVVVAVDVEAVVMVSVVGGPARKMSFFQMAPKLFLSDQTHSNRCKYELYEVWFNKIDHIHTYVAAKVIMFFH